MSTLLTNEGCVLRMPYKVEPDVVRDGFGHSIVALQGWLKLAESTHKYAGIAIPMQPRVVNWSHLEVPMTLRDLVYADLRRGEGELSCLVTLSGLANIPYTPPPRVQTATSQPWITVAVKDNGTGVTFTVPREQWLRLLASAGLERTRLVELPVAGGAVGPQWAECMRLVSRASSQLKANEIEAAIATSRQVVEGIAIVFANQWGVDLPHGSMRQRLKELQGRIAKAWPEDAEAGELLTALYAAAWSWTSPEHHYDSRMPRREEAAFAVSLAADMLTHAGHLLQAHPQPLKSNPAPTDGSTTRVPSP